MSYHSSSLSPPPHYGQFMSTHPSQPIPPPRRNTVTCRPIPKPRQNTTSCRPTPKPRRNTTSCRPTPKPRRNIATSCRPTLLPRPNPHHVLRQSIIAGRPTPRQRLITHLPLNSQQSSSSHSSVEGECDHGSSYLHTIS